MKLKDIKSLEELRKKLQKCRETDKKTVTICAGTGCLASNSDDVVKAFRDYVKQSNLNGKVEILQTGCHGFCERGPLVVIHPDGILYQRVTTGSVKDIIDKTVLKGKILDDLLYKNPQTGKKIVFEKDIPFYNKQSRLILGSNGLIDPKNITDYISGGGYVALSKTLLMKPGSIIDEVKKAGLRGRGGAGFPTGIKWEITRNAKGTIKYIVCNADEGDPGAYMNRSVLEGNPHSVIEGMIIGAFAIGAAEGFVYVRYEYPLAVKNLAIALEEAREFGLLGNNILGSDFNFDIEVVRGAGAFVCGEETALMASIEGKKGVPRQRPPFPSEKGIFGKPTNINNVETWANVPLIINKGADWYSKIGTDGSKGTKIFSLVGKINNTGLVEVPMGTNLSEIIFDIGGGIPNGKKLKAVQIGGPSGGCIPENAVKVPIDYDALKKLGSMMGSGGMVVMDEDTCMVDNAKYFLNFLLEESCGKCTTCREGIERMLEVVTNITEGNGKMDDISTLEQVAEVVKDASMCGLGQTSPNPVLSTLRYFRAEYETHIKDKKCPAGVCKALISFSIDPDNCTGCGACTKRCPQGAISGEKKKAYRIDVKKCIKCGVCYDTCKFHAISKKGDK